MASVEKLPAMSKFLFLVALLLLLLWGDSHAQQPYVNNQQLACENQNSNITKGYYCNSPQKSCQSYITFRSTPPYDSAVSIGFLLNATATLITSLNNFSDDFSTIPHNKLVLVPVDCSCSGSYYQHNSNTTIRYQNETYFIISNNTYQGLTTCQAMIAQNPYNYRDLKVGNRLLVPLRCACPTSGQVAAGFKYLLSYLVTWGDSVSAIAAKFGANEKSVMDANELSDGDVIFPFTPILVPLRGEPKIIEQQQTSPPSAPPPQTPTVVGESKSSKKWVFVGVAAAASSLLLLSLFGFIFCLYRRRSRKPKPLLESAPPPLPPHKFSDSSEYPPSLSSQGIRYEIESLTLYKFEDIQAATGNFNESNRIKGSVYRASFKDDDAAVKVMKGDVSAEINLLKKINHTNIIRLSGFCLHEGSSYLVYQYAEKGCVSDWLQSNKHQTSYTLSWQQRVRIAYDVADALNYLHNYTNPSYIHKNLKTSNILLDENLRAKVANFGLARTMENGDEGGLQLTRHVVGTQGYLAPEYIANGVITPKLDVFAFGVVMLELLSGREAADAEKSGGGEMLSASIQRVLEGDNVREKLQGFMDPRLQHEYPLELAFSMAQLAKNCVARDLNARPSTDEVLVTLSKILSSSLDWDPSDELNSSTSMSSKR